MRIIGAYDAGAKPKDIRRDFNVSKSALKRIVKKFKEKGSISNSPGQGRKRKTSPTDDHAIMISVKKKPFSTVRKIRADVNLPEVSLTTIARRIKESGEVSSYWASRKPFIGPKNIRDRLAWCHRYKYYTKSFWRRVLWSDESPYMLRQNVKKRVWRGHNDRYNNKYTKGTVKHDKKINVWGGFCAHGVGTLHRIEGIMVKETYNDLLGNVMLPSADMLFGRENWHFQQDNDPKHTAKINKQWFIDWEIPIIDWPSQSPDLNPIENLWSILDRKCANRTCKNELELFEDLKTEWYKLTPDTLTKLVDSMPSRIEACIKAGGKSTKY